MWFYKQYGFANPINLLEKIKKPNRMLMDSSYEQNERTEKERKIV